MPLHEDLPGVLSNYASELFQMTVQDPARSVSNKQVERIVVTADQDAIEQGILRPPHQPEDVDWEQPSTKFHGIQNSLLCRLCVDEQNPRGFTMKKS